MEVITINADVLEDIIYQAIKESWNMEETVQGGTVKAMENIREKQM